MSRILVLPTGGTICTAVQSGIRSIAGDAGLVILSRFSGTHPDAGAAFTVADDLGILSENLTVDNWNTIRRLLAKADGFDGVIVLHGTDTLAYTAAMLAVLHPCSVPVMLCSANRPPADPLSNADANFAACVSCITAGIAPGVYAASQNADGTMYLHQGARLQSCRDAWGNFYSDTMQPLTQALHIPAGALPEIRGLRNALAADVLCIMPHPGLDYSRIPLTGIRAVLHGVYHSGTVCTDAPAPYSIRMLAEQCRSKGVSLWIAPAAAQGEIYESTAHLAGQVQFVSGLTQETLFALLTAAEDPAEAVTQAGGIIT